MNVTDLFIKRAHDRAMEPVRCLQFDPQGIASGVRCSPLRQVLITSCSVSRDCGLEPGDLRENIVVDAEGLYDLASGSVITFHCEPCKKILHLVAFDRILHKRGFLGCFLNSGTIACGDPVTVTEQQLEPIPYTVKDRVRWFLGRQDPALAATELAHALGLPSSYARAIPRLVESFAVARRARK